MFRARSFLHRFPARATLAAACVVCSAIPAPCFAEDHTPSAADVSMARTLGVEGVQLADAGNCAQAIEKLQRAEDLYHAPTILGRLGECQVAVGKIVLGSETLERVVREPLSPKAPAAFSAAHARAQKALDAALPRIAKLRVHVDPPSAPALQVKLDDELLPAAALDVDRPTDPGHHDVDVSATGYRWARTPVNLAEGASQTLSIRLDPEATPLAAATPAAAVTPSNAGASPAIPLAITPQQQSLPPPSTEAAPAPADHKESPSGSGARTAGFVLLGVGGAGLVVGTIFGVLALSAKSSLDDACGGNKGACPASTQDKIDSMKTRGTIATVGFIGGAALAATGGVLLIVGGRSSNKEGAPQAGSPSLRVGAFIGPTSAGLAGDF